jgi:hypothetical protein
MIMKYSTGTADGTSRVSELSRSVAVRLLRHIGVGFTLQEQMWEYECIAWIRWEFSPCIIQQTVYVSAYMVMKLVTRFIDAGRKRENIRTEMTFFHSF